MVEGCRIQYPVLSSPPLLHRTNKIERVILNHYGPEVYLAVRAIEPAALCPSLYCFLPADQPEHRYPNGCYLTIAHNKALYTYNSITHTLLMCTHVLSGSFI